jgi:acyl dehydratase
MYRSHTLNFHGPVKIATWCRVVVEVVELRPKGRMVRLACEASVDGKVMLHEEAVVSAPARRKAMST